jgi:hypothetical protein
MNSSLLPDIDTYPVLDWFQFKWLLEQGVPVDTLISLTPIHCLQGIVANDGRFDEDPCGKTFLAFREPEDVVLWRPGTEQIGTWLGRSFALNEDAIYNPGTYIFNHALNVYRSPLDWLRNRCDGCVVIDWNRAWPRLQDVPRIAVDETLLLKYRRHMQPPKGPEAFVVTDWRAAA